MTDGQWLFTLFALLYGVECLRFYPGAVWMYADCGKRGWLRRPLQHLDFAGRKFLLLPVLPPVPVQVVLMPWLLVPCAEGLEILNAAGKSAELILWAELKPTMDAAVLRLGPDQALRFTDEATAAAWLKDVQGWQGLADAARERDFLKLAAQMLDAKGFAAVLADLAARTRWLRLLGTLIFGLCFGVITGIYRWLGEGPQVLLAASIQLLLMGIQAVVFWRVTGRLKEPIKHRFWKALAISLLPQHAMRAADHVCAALPFRAHPLAAVGCVRESARVALVRPFWKLARYGQMRSASLQQRALEGFLKAQGMTVSLLEVAPEQEFGAAAFCPCCEAQFGDAQALCQDCGGLALKRFV